MQTVTIKIDYPNGDSELTIFDLTTVILSKDIYSDIKTYIKSNYKEYVGYSVWFLDRLVYSNRNEEFEMNHTPNLRFEIEYFNGDKICKTIDFSTFIQSKDIYSDIKQYVESNYKDNSRYEVFYKDELDDPNHIFFYKDGLVYSSDQEELETILIALRLYYDTI